ncbi:MAG: [FeFe] hydrogenase H-cluster radical SAM maturase HydG [Acidobacteriota bacterium]
MIIDEKKIWDTLAKKPSSEKALVEEILKKAMELKGLSLEDIPPLLRISDPELLDSLFTTAKKVKERIYGKRLVLFAPLYISNLCSNECVYCAFRATNKGLKRRALNYDEIKKEVELLVDQGHKRILLVAGESYPREGLDYILKAIDIIYSVKNRGEIRRVNVNIAPLKTEEFKKLKERHIGTYQLFQETYHRETYKKVHLGGVKKDYDFRITAMDRAMEAGIDDVGIGVLFGLFDYRFEVMAILQHANYLDSKYGVGPHTISVPRLEPAAGSKISEHPPFPVSDVDFRKIVAILRLAVPYTGIILSTRETAEIRRETFAVGVSQISAGSRTNPGGYSLDEEFDASQFSLGDHRSLAEVIEDITKLGYIPSFCTACYRLGRTGKDFMDLAKPGEIQNHCSPNALATFAEYLEDYAPENLKNMGYEMMEKHILELPSNLQEKARKMVQFVKEGKRDVYL